MNSTNCKAWESVIALYIEGDLSASDLSRVVSHLDSCTACRYFADDLRESQSMFKTLRAGTVNSADLVGVRQRVLNQVGDLDPAPGWVLAMHRLFFAGLRRRNAVAGVLLAALVAGSVWYSQMPPVREMNPVRETRQAGTIEVARVESPEPVGLTNVTPPAGVAPRTLQPEDPPTVSDDLSKEDLALHVSDDQVASESESSQVIPFKFVTDDPDIIIYWLPKDKGD